MQKHITVLTEEAVNALAINESSIVVDATLGAGGHAQKIVARLGKQGTFIGIDADQSAIHGAEELLTHALCSTHLTVGNFRNLDSILDLLHIQKIDAILADLGWRMEQFSGNGKGFSFQVDEELLMTFGDPKEYSFTARDIVNTWEEQQIVSIIRGYGEERFAGRIAKQIVEERETAPIQTTFDLVHIIEHAVPNWYLHGRIHPATRTFQALRIAVNDEFEALELCIRKSIERLNPTGRLAIISFHSLEDRIVKHLFRSLAHDHIGTVITKKPITASPEELAQNPRSRSAKLRIFEKYETAT